jgi:tetratricopeptide (TPR) repeat protein
MSTVCVQSNNINKLKYDKEINIDSGFFNRPKEHQFVKDIKEVLYEWLILAGVEENKTNAVIDRFPSFFVYALDEEWRRNEGIYKRLFAETPFCDSVVAEDDWERYRAFLDKQTQESIFDEAFSLSQIYIQLCGYFDINKDNEKQGNKQEDIFTSRKTIERNKDNEKQGNKQDDTFTSRKTIERHIVDLTTYMHMWINKDDKDDAIRIISGGPGSGKSCFAKMFAASISITNNVLFIPLYQLDLSRDVEEVIGKFLISNDFFNVNPIGTTEPLLLIFDGLDEIAQQGKVSLNVARDFVTQILQLLRNYNHIKLKIRIIITGRDLPVQEIETYFKREEQIIYVLPYYNFHDESDLALYEYIDPNNLLIEDKRELWWSKYSQLTGKPYSGFPLELKKQIFDDVTSQPLLNYLLALSYDRKRIDFADETNAKEANLNELYSDLVDAVYERDWQHPHKGYRAIEGIEKEEYERILEEIAVSVWQGDGRTATIRAIEERCEKNNLKRVLDKFQDKAKEGVTTLLTAFYFRDTGIRAEERTFEFTHKSFGEYLAARRIVKQLETTKKAIAQQKEYQCGWTYETALEKWIEICSNVPIDEYIFNFLRNEIKLYDMTIVKGWQNMLCDIIGDMLKPGMPLDKITQISFIEKARRSRNSEEALLATISACARYTGEISRIEWARGTSAVEWLSKLIYYQRWPNFTTKCLNHLDLSGCVLRGMDFGDADFTHSCLCECDLSYSVLVNADLSNTKINKTLFQYANLDEADLSEAIFEADPSLFLGARLNDVISEDAQIYAVRGYNYDREENYLRAIADYTKAIELVPDNAEYYSNRSVCYHCQGKYGRAVDDCTKAIELVPDNAEYYDSRGVSYLMLGKYDKAVDDCTKAIELAPNNARYYSNRSVCYHYQGEYDKAVDDCTKAIELAPDNAEYYDSRGTSHHCLRKYDKAVADHTKAIELAPDNATYYDNRGNSYCFLCEYHKAIHDLKNAIEINPENVDYYSSTAFCLYKIGETDLAFENLDKAFSLNENSPSCYRVRALINLKMAKRNKKNRDQHILDDFNRSIELAKEQKDNTLYLCYSYRAEYYIYINELDKAYDDLRASLDSNEQFYLTWFYLAKYHEEKGHAQEYEQCFNKAKEYGYIPDEDD